MMAAVMMHNPDIIVMCLGKPSRFDMIALNVKDSVWKAKINTPTLRSKLPETKYLRANFDASLASPQLESTPIILDIKIPISNHVINKSDM
ncbi:hypothetical protein GCM10023330_02780 [Litoribaculum gwangyangense]|uniref:Uncharacterized protein n=1 Tax=Litoribaculum gwangyangense TaxID=1130722 RepID=A0ABP9BUD9_9FLAO